MTPRPPDETLDALFSTGEVRFVEYTGAWKVDILLDAFDLIESPD